MSLKGSCLLAHSMLLGLAGVAVFSSGAIAHAQPDGESGLQPGEASEHDRWPIRWRSPDGCSSEPEFSAALAEHLPRRSAHVNVDVAVTVRRAPGARWRVHIELSTATDGAIGERAFSDHSCAAVVDAAALVVALALEEAATHQPSMADSALHRVPRAPDLLPAPATVSRIEPPALRIHTRATLADSPRLGSGLRITTGAGLGRLPGLAPELGVAAVGARGRWRLEVLTAVLTAREVTTSGVSGRAEIALWTTGVRGCARVRSIWLCGGAHLERWSGRGIDLFASRSGSMSLVGLSAALAWKRQLWRRLGLWIETGATVPAAVPRFTLIDGTLLHQPARLSAALVAGLELRIR